ncbi:tail fiber protein [Xenorhabdus bovienii]|uniref:tail fiber protein n=1 Tax=Xenorhabdus bovienii TaxID=40576 RepID=UPI0023B27327|nr:tail fiber protein [Xenorhabdus bovienii]MDE9441387.1 phage tail protein [Xenorhabdus bovienii]MDE9457617.1 phage tail protein [Xenorhabdus bovienii]MDE9514494.1 phage tail protein [Xenorhabdus bovienii]
MSESNVFKTTQEQQKSSNQNAIGTDIETLKSKFKEGSIPLQTDFRKLIDIADIGRRAVGKAPDQDGPAHGMLLDDNGLLQLKINEEHKSENNSPLKLDKDVLVVGLGNGIKSDANGIAIDPNKVLPKGMIVMFSGDSAPEGWAFCDGGEHNGIRVPDLRNRFIACGNTINETGESSHTLSGEKNNKTYSATTNKIKTGLTVTVNDTKLEPDQLPEHFHYDGMPYDSENGNLHGITAEEPISNIGIHKKSYDVTLHGMISFESFMNRFNPGWRSEFKFRILNNSDSVVKKDYKVMYKFHTSPVGSGKGHTHTASVTDPEHSHKVDITPPYYLLAFIMKL